MPPIDAGQGKAAPAYRYHAFGLVIASRLPLPELAADHTGARTPDITVDVEPVPEIAAAAGPAGARRLGPFLWASADHIWFRVPGIARFRITGGRAIAVEPEPDGDAAGVRTFLLGTALGLLLTRRGHLILHGNAVRVGDGCVLCVGRSGAGKSTLAAGFHRRGYGLLADDLVMVDAHCAVTPGIPRLKLWADMTRALAIDTAPLDRIRPDLDKFSYPIGDRFAREPVPVRALYALGTTNDDSVSIAPLTGFAKFTEVRANTYRPRIVAAVAPRDALLGLCARLAAAVPVAALRRPVRGFTVDALIDAILTDLGERG